MGAKQSKRSVDISATPKKGEGDSPIVEGEGKIEKIGELDGKITNGDVHKEVDGEEKDSTPEKEQETIKENGVSDSEDTKTPDAEVSVNDKIEEAVNEKPSTDEKIEEVVEKKKEKTKKKKFSFRGLSFGKKDKCKPNKEEKNEGVKEVTEEEQVATSPQAEAPAKIEGEKPKEEAPAPITNGDAAPEEAAKVAEEPAKPAEEPAKPAEASKAEEPVKETPAPVTEEVKEEVKPPVEEPSKEETKPEEPKPVEPVVEETKEVAAVAAAPVTENGTEARRDDGDKAAEVAEPAKVEE